ncbi:hypothetical protein [Streptomyces sp. WMMC905]|uniref:hypothetical protein n=1 Tax=Streptomyces sp. WMMC905 TaxID=3404123 RepID=UPI003B952414
MEEDDPCDALEGTPGYDFCARDNNGGGPPDGGPPGPVQNWTDGAVSNVRELAQSLAEKITHLVAPDSTWAPEQADDWVYQQFFWLGQHLAIAIFICVVVVCALTAWQGAPRLRQLGASTGWTLAAIAGMAAVPGAVTLLNKAVSEALQTMFDSDESTLFDTITEDMAKAADADNPLAVLLIFCMLLVALAFATLVFMTRNLGILVFVCIAPVVLASLARGGDTSAVIRWAQRLLGLMFAPLALLLVGLFVPLAEGSLVMDAVLLVAADLLMLRMIFHGVPYFGPRLAGAARSMVERRTDHPVVRGVVRAGVPDVYERESEPRGPRAIDTPGRAAYRDGGVLLSAYGVPHQERPGRLTTDSAAARAYREESERAERQGRIGQARRAARTEARGPGGPGVGSGAPAADAAGRRAPGPRVPDGRAPEAGPPPPDRPGGGAP